MGLFVHPIVKSFTRPFQHFCNRNFKATPNDIHKLKLTYCTSINLFLRVVQDPSCTWNIVVFPLTQAQKIAHLFIVFARIPFLFRSRVIARVSSLLQHLHQGTLFGEFVLCLFCQDHFFIFLTFIVRIRTRKVNSVDFGLEFFSRLEASFFPFFLLLNVLFVPLVEAFNRGIKC